MDIDDIEMYDCMVDEMYERNILVADKHTWITRDSKQVDIKKMSTPHIENCIAMLKPYSDIYDDAIHTFNRELERRSKLPFDAQVELMVINED